MKVVLHEFAKNRESFRNRSNSIAFRSLYVQPAHLVGQSRRFCNRNRGFERAFCTEFAVVFLPGIYVRIDRHVNPLARVRRKEGVKNEDCHSEVWVVNANSKPPRRRRGAGTRVNAATLFVVYYRYSRIWSRLDDLPDHDQFCREAARRAIITGADDQEVIDSINSYLDAASIHDSDRTIEIRDSSGDVVSIADIGSHEEITIFISVPFDENSFGLTSWFVGRNMSTQVTMRRE